MMAVAAFKTVGYEFFHLDASETLGSLVLCVVKETTLRECDVLDVPFFPRARCSGGHGW